MKKLDCLIRKLSNAVIVLYQQIFSWDHRWRYIVGGVRICRWYPSCSEYARRAFIQHRSATAISLIFRRLLRCHPGSAGGVDYDRIV